MEFSFKQKESARGTEVAERGDKNGSAKKMGKTSLRNVQKRWQAETEERTSRPQLSSTNLAYFIHVFAPIGCRSRNAFCGEGFKRRAASGNLQDHSDCSSFGYRFGYKIVCF